MMIIQLTISTSNDIKLIVLTALLVTLIFYLLIIKKLYRFIRQLQKDNEQYREKTIQDLNEKSTNST